MAIMKTLNGFEIYDEAARKEINYLKRSFANVAAMKADTTLQVGMIVTTNGYYSPSTGGDATYIIRTKTDTDTEDGGVIHFLANGLVAELNIENGIVYAKQFGIKGENLVGKVDETATLQRVITFCSNKGYKLIVSDLSIYIVETIKFHKAKTFNSNFVIEFVNSRIYTDQPITMVEWCKLDGETYPSGYRMLVKGLHLYGGGVATCGLKINSLQCYTLENFYIDYCSIGLEISNVFYGAMRGHSSIVNCGIGIDFAGAESNGQVIQNLWIAGGITHDAENSIGIRLNGTAYSMLFENVTIESYTIGIKQDNSNSNFVSSFKGIYLENISKQFMHFRGGTNNNIQIENSHTNETKSAIQDNGFVVCGGTYSIFNNNFKDHLIYINGLNTKVDTDMETVCFEGGIVNGWQQLVNRHSNYVNERNRFVERNSVIVRDEKLSDVMKLRPVYNYQSDDIEFVAEAGVILTSPSGTRYKMQVDDEGNFTMHKLHCVTERCYYNSLPIKDIIALGETLKTDANAYPYTELRCNEVPYRYSVVDGNIVGIESHNNGIALFGDISYILACTPPVTTYYQLFIYNTDIGVFYSYAGNHWVNAGARPSASHYSTWERAAGTTAQRPSTASTGFKYYDTDLLTYVTKTADGWA